MGALSAGHWLVVIAVVLILFVPVACRRRWASWRAASARSAAAFGTSRRRPGRWTRATADAGRRQKSWCPAGGLEPVRMDELRLFTAVGFAAPAAADRALGSRSSRPC